MTKQERLRHLMYVRQAISEYEEYFKCKEGCNECCGLIPISTIEKELMVNKREVGDMDCPYSSETGCANYEQRPVRCRVYGITDFPIIKCGYVVPSKIIPFKILHKILEYYEKNVMTAEDKEEERIIQEKHNQRSKKGFLEQFIRDPMGTIKQMEDKMAEFRKFQERI